MEWLFGRRKTLTEYGREWKASIDKQKREIDRDLQNMLRAEAKTRREIRAKAQQGEAASARALAAELVRSRTARARLEKTKTQMTAVHNKLSECVAMANLSGSIRKSADLMRMMNRLTNLPQLHAAMATMSKEMASMDLIGEGIDEGLEMMDDDELDEDVNEAVGQVMDEIALDLDEAAPSSGLLARSTNNRVRVDQIMGSDAEGATAPIL